MQTPMLKISILTPIYGVEKYIEQCARSLFEQSYVNIEYIFVNDCTPDQSISILNDVIKLYPTRKEQVHIIHHSQNQGVGAARQTALMEANGDYVMFVDSDDFLPIDAVEKLAEKIVEKRVGKVVDNNVDNIATTSTTIRNEQPPDLIDGGYCEWRNGKASLPRMPFDIEKQKYLKLLICQNLITNRLWGRIYKRSVITDHKIFFQKGVDYAEDLFWNAQFLYHAQSKVVLNEVVYGYRTDNINSYNHSISEKNLLSYFRSFHLLAMFLEHQPTARHYRKALDIGLVNAYRWAKNAHVDLSKADDIIAYHPKSWMIRSVIQLIRWGVPIKYVNWLYLSYRRLYVYLS